MGRIGKFGGHQKTLAGWSREGGKITVKDTNIPLHESREEAAVQQRAALTAPARQLQDMHTEKEDGKIHRNFVVYSAKILPSAMKYSLGEPQNV